MGRKGITRRAFSIFLALLLAVSTAGSNVTWAASESGDAAAAAMDSTDTDDVAVISDTDGAASAELVLTEEIELMQYVNSSTYYDDEGAGYSYYAFFMGMFSEGDQLIVTLSDGTTETYTHDGDFFYDTEDDTLSYSVSSTQETDHWETGQTYYYTLTLTAYDDITVDVPVSIVENPYFENVEDLTETGTGTANIYEAGAIAYFTFTPSESGYYKIVTEETYLYLDLYSSDWELLYSVWTKNPYIKYNMTAGTTYYICARYWDGSSETNTFSVSVSSYSLAVSAEAVLTQDIVLYEGIDSDSRTVYDSASGEYVTYEYYSYSSDIFSSGDEIIVTRENGSTDTYVFDGSAFYDDEDNSLSISGSSTQSSSSQWEVGGSYYYTLTLYDDEDVTVEIPVTIAANPYEDATAEFIAADGNPELMEYLDTTEMEYYDSDSDDWIELTGFSPYSMSFSEGDQIVITLSDGTTETYTYSGGEFYDEDGENYLYYDYTGDYCADQAASAWAAGNTYYFQMYLSQMDLTLEIPVDIVENPYLEAAVDISDSGEGTAVIDEAGGYAYFIFTASESGTYRFYSTGSSDTYAYLYDSNMSLLSSDDDSGSGSNAMITYDLEAGSTYYVVFRYYSSSRTGSFSVYCGIYYPVVSAVLNLTQDLTLIEGIDSYSRTDDDDETYNYYYFWSIDFSDGDEIVLTRSDGSTETYTYSSSYYGFCDEDGTELSYSYSSDQSSEHWEVGGTYYFTLTLEDDVTLEIPVTIVENPYTGSEISYITADGSSTLTAYEGIDSWTNEDDDGEEYEYYDFWYVISDGDQITITLTDGTVYTYTYSNYDFYDADGNYLSWLCSNTQDTEHWEVGGTYVFTMELEDYGLTFEIPVTICANPYEGASAVFTAAGDTGVYYEKTCGFESSSYGCFRYYWESLKLFTAGDTITITLADGSTEVYTAVLSSYGYSYSFKNEDGDTLSYDHSSCLNSEEWEAGEHSVSITIFNEVELEIPVVISEVVPVSAVFSAVDGRSVSTLPAEDENYGYWYEDDDEGDWFYYYAGYALQDGDQVVLTLSDGSTETYTYDSYYGNFYNSEGEFEDLYMRSTWSRQYNDHWTEGNTYDIYLYFYYYSDLMDDITLQVAIGDLTDLADATVSLGSSSMTYTGSALTPSVTVTYDGTTLTSGTDYTVSYSNNTNVGTATVTVTGKGSYTGTVSKTFTITAQALSSSRVTLAYTSKAYTGSALTPSVTVKNAAGSTVSSSYYTVSYSNNKNVGTATVKVTGSGNYSGTVSKTFTITKQTLSSSYITLSYTSTTYTGKSKTPTVTVKNSAGKKLTKGTHYTISYSKSTRKAIGSYTITIKGKGSYYTGTVKLTYKIVPKTMTVKSLTSSAKKKLTVKWTKTTGSVTKYQIRYRVKGTSTWKTKTVSSSSSSVTLTGLKSGKTYQVQIRAYKTVSGTKYYGSWSSAKTKKVK